MSVPTAELAAPAAERPATGASPLSARLTGGHLYIALAVAVLVIAALSLLIPSTPSYDPWAWLVWGREIAHLDLQTTGGPTWKPLPVIFTTAFSPFGAAAPDLWLVVARAGGIMGVLLAATLAFRLGRAVADRAAAVTAAAFAAAGVIAERDGENPAWTIELKTLEAARLAEMRTEARDAINTSNAAALERLGTALLRLGQPGEAIACFEKALAYEPDEIDALTGLGTALAETGKLDDAVRVWRRALESGEGAHLHQEIARALRRLGRRAEARGHAALARRLLGRGGLFGYLHGAWDRLRSLKRE